MERRIGHAVTTFVCAALVAACGTKDDESVPPETQRDIRDQLEAYYRDFSTRDWDAFAAHFWPGADLTTVWQPPGEDRERVVATSIDEFIAQAPQGPGSREIFEEWIIDAQFRVSGNLAQAWVRFGARFGDPGDVTEWEGTDAITLLRHEGNWKIASLVFASEQ